VTPIKLTKGVDAEDAGASAGGFAMEGAEASEVEGLVAGASDGVAETGGDGGDEIGANPAGDGSGANLRDGDGTGADFGAGTGAAPGAWAEMRVRDAMRRAKMGRWREETAICVIDCLRPS
jgi:hypothetical protein